MYFEKFLFHIILSYESLTETCLGDNIDETIDKL